VGVEETSYNVEKNQVLLSSFFPKMPEPTLESTTSIREKIPWAPVTALEIERALKAAKGNTALGKDGLPILVWKNIWTFVSHLAPRSLDLHSIYQPRILPEEIENGDYRCAEKAWET
jgi:hypothetical protein